MGQVVLLSGDAGIGKSRLVQAFMGRIAREAHLRVECRCAPYLQHSPFHPLIDYLRRWLQVCREDSPQEQLHQLEGALASSDFCLPEVLPLFAALLSLPLPACYPLLAMTPQQHKQKTLEVLLALLLHETEQKPVCLVMEDLHWVDPSTREFLGFLITQVPTVRMMVLLIFRPEFRPPWGSHSYQTHLVLNRLTCRQVEVMVERMTGGKALPAEVRRQLVVKTDGVPLFVEELTKMVLESGLVREREGCYELTGALSPLAIPSTLHDSLMARLDQIGAAKHVAQLGATLGREFSYEVIRAVAPLEEAWLQEGLAQLVGAELLYQRGLPPRARYTFKHALIQDAAYQSLLPCTRQQYHRRIVQVFEARFPETCETQPEIQARHYTEAGLGTQAVHYWQRAGQLALERSANVEAIHHLTQGLEVLRTLPETPERIRQELTLQLTLNTALKIVKGLTAPEVQHACSRVQELCQQVGDTPQRFSALARLWGVNFPQGRLPLAHELGVQCFALAQHLREPGLLQEADQILGSTLMHMGELVAARPHLERAVHLAPPPQHLPVLFNLAADPGVMSRSYLAWLLWLLGYPEQALHRSQEALCLAQASSHLYSRAFASHYAAVVRQCCQDAALVQQHADAEIALAREHEFGYRLAGGLITRGWALAAQGWLQDGLGELRQGLVALQALGIELFRPYWLTLLAETSGRAGRYEEGLGVLAEALAITRRNAEHLYASEAYRLTGELLLQVGERCPPRVTLPGMPPARTRATSTSFQYVEAEAAFQKALEVARHQQAKSLELRAAISLGRLWQRQGRWIEAYVLVSEVYGWFSEGFETADLQEARAFLEGLVRHQPVASEVTR